MSPRRLGALLHDTRVARGVDVEHLAAQSFFTSADLLAIEAGDRNLTDRELTEVLDVYHVEVDDLLPERTRLVIDLEERRVAAGGRQRSVAGGSPTPDRVLASYLSLVYALRHATPGSPLVLRDADLEVLAQALDLAKPTVTSRLHALMTEPDLEVRRRSRLLRGRVLLPVAGVIVAATAVGTLLMVQADDTETVTVEPAAPAASVAPEPNFVVPNPDVGGREKILRVHMRKVPLAPDVDAKVIARGTPGFSGADLANLVNEAALLAARRNKRLVTQAEFEALKAKVIG